MRPLHAQALFGYYSTTLHASGSYGEMKSGPDEPANSAPDRVKTCSPGLPPRQRAVLELIIQGQSNKQIARSLGISEKTVKVHVCILFQKLGVNTRTSAAVAGLRLLQSEVAASTNYGWSPSQAQTNAYRVSLQTSV